MEAASDRFGVFLLVMTRGVPVVAEASVLLMGIHRMAWRRFLLPVMLSNLGIALAYSTFGDVAGQHQWLPAALAMAIALPVIMAVMLHRVLKRGAAK
jgi:membrane protein DedA with SNARE-associated domain